MTLYRLELPGAHPCTEVWALQPAGPAGKDRCSALLVSAAWAQSVAGRIAGRLPLSFTARGFLAAPLPVFRVLWVRSVFSDLHAVFSGFCRLFGGLLRVRLGSSARFDGSPCCLAPDIPHKEESHVWPTQPSSAF